VATASHVRPTAKEIRTVIQTGASTSTTFRRLLIELDGSDVIVYVAPRLKHNGLGGYLSHAIVSSGGFRYLRVHLNITGPARSIVPILAHELQHVVEVAHAREVRDSESVARLFGTLATRRGCGSNCFETQEAIDVERMVKIEMMPATVLSRESVRP
jgi:hypothetical protein